MHAIVTHVRMVECVCLLVLTQCGTSAAVPRATLEHTARATQVKKRSACVAGDSVCPPFYGKLCTNIF